MGSGGLALVSLNDMKKGALEMIWKMLGRRDFSRGGGSRGRGSPASGRLGVNGSRRDFFRKGLFSALAVGGLTQFRNRAGAEERAETGGARGAAGIGRGPLTGGDRGNFPDRFEAIKKAATPEELYTFLYAVPKGGDLHHHHGGSSFAADWFRLGTDSKLNGGQRYYTRTRIGNCEESSAAYSDARGQKNLLYWVNIHEGAWRSLSECERNEFKPLEALTDGERQRWESSMVLDRPTEGMNEFFERHWNRINHLSTNPHIMSELLVQNMKSFSKEGLIYMEPQVSTGGFVDRDGRRLSEEEGVTVYRNRLNQRDALETGVTVRCLRTILRYSRDAPSRVASTFDFVYRHNDLWRGVNMAGREDNERGHPSRFTEAFDQALRRYPDVGIAIHAGEENEPSKHIFDTLRLGAKRIGHGVNLIKDAETMQLMRCGKFMVEINLVSNHLLGYVDDPKAHPFPIYMRQGIPCALSTDDRGMWDSGMTDEYYSAVVNFNLSWDELVGLGRNSLKFSFAQRDLKAQLKSHYEKNIAACEGTYGSGDWRRPLRSVKPVTHGYTRRQFGLDLGR